MSRRPQGLVIINTGNGKGKTTAALGLMFRAWGHNFRVTMLQFIKSDRRKTGEHLAAERLSIDLVPMGDGFTWLSKDLEQSRTLAREAWRYAEALIMGGEFDVVILDELTYPLQYLWISTDEVLACLSKRPPHVHVVITGRAAPEALVEAADLVTEMREVRHPYRDRGLQAQRGVDF